MSSPAKADPVLTGHGVVHPWLCDAMGHLTTRHYLGFFDDATWHLLAELGYRPADAAAEAWGWADVRNELDYRAEVPAGGLIRVFSTITGVGRTSLSMHHVMANRETGGLTAEMTAKLVCFDLSLRAARPLPDQLRAEAESRLPSAA